MIASMPVSVPPPFSFAGVSQFLEAGERQRKRGREEEKHVLDEAPDDLLHFAEPAA